MSLRRWRLGAISWLALVVLSACQAPAPVTPVEPVPEAAPPPADDVGVYAERSETADLLASESCEREGNYVCAVEALARHIWQRPSTESPRGRTTPNGIANKNYPPGPQPQAAHDRLWRLTAGVSPTRVAALAQGHTLAPLWRLRKAMSGSQSAHEQAALLRAWMAHWPNHPFNTAPPSNLAKLLEPLRQPGRVALFVPLSGPLAAAGRAVRDGFIAAYFHDAAPQRPGLRIYDTASKQLPALYEQSLVDDIDLIVGPLSKLKLEALHRLKPELPVLGLNYLDARVAVGAAGGIDSHGSTQAAEPPGPLFMQVGLAIEDEAATITARLLKEDLERLLAVHSTEDWALRGVRELADSWPFDIERQAFADVKTITESVGTAMRVAASLERRDALERLLNEKLEFLPRARSDLDGVVAFVNPIEAAALAPALKFHFASHLPVYASSQSVRDSSTLDELDGFNVLEMPFNLQPDPPVERREDGIRRQPRQRWRTSCAGHGRLSHRQPLAMGIRPRAPVRRHWQTATHRGRAHPPRTGLGNRRARHRSRAAGKFPSVATAGAGEGRKR